MTTLERALVKRIGKCFALVVCLLPLVLWGGWWQLALLPMLVVATLAFVSAMQLRRVVRRGEAPQLNDGA